MANPIQALNENFFYNSMIARSLIQLMPEKDRSKMRAWLDKLLDTEEDPEQLTIRNDYMWFLLLMIQSKRVTVPFNKPPPSQLVPLKEILPEDVYEEILLTTDETMCCSVTEGGECPEDQDKIFSETKQEPIRAPPSVFLTNQPLPREGIICYMAVFSDHDD
ncbi:uncharacterized protein LOC108735995 [Agrilus planipennis]|uniref:Uncharacterized protein LOC108735995 n=1 Tax=Agrilus planipennis TaxID=224129 RepID=A0A7F5R8E0_AGRPL|nr:uncharacterized protein LOC108735995 [Agrilus planipennis]